MITLSRKREVRVKATWLTSGQRWAGLGCEKCFGSRKDLLASCARQAFKIPGHHRRPVVALQDIGMVLDKPPVQAVDRITPIAPAEVSHLHEITGTTKIGFGRKNAAITK